jgi:Ala-tRNA(Pro) deacylase
LDLYTDILLYSISYYPNMKNFDPTLFSFFQQHNLSYEYFEHQPIFTVEEWESLKQSLPGKQTKNLFLTDKRGQYRLVCVESSKRLQINQFRKLVDSKNMTFASPEDMKELLHLTPWSVSIFWLIHKPKNLDLYLDNNLREADLIGRHPNHNDATIVISHETLVKFLDIVGVEVNILKIWEELKIVQ